MDSSLFFQQNQQTLLQLANTEAGRYLLSVKDKAPIVKVTPSSYTQLMDFYRGRVIYRSTFFPASEVNLYLATPYLKMGIAEREYKRIQNQYEAFLHFAELKKSYKYPQIYLTTSTFYPSAGQVEPADGTVRDETVGTWATLRAAAGDSASPTGTTLTVQIRSTFNTDEWNKMERAILMFDTSSIGSEATISAASMFLYGTAVNESFGGNPAIHVAASNPASTSDVVAGDYDAISRTSFANIVYSSFSTSAYNELVLDSNGEANVDKTGISKYSLQLSSDINNSAPTWASNDLEYIQCRSADQAGTAKDPYLSVTYMTATAGGFMTLNRGYWGA